MFNSNTTTISGFSFGGASLNTGFGGTSAPMFGSATTTTASGFGNSIFGTSQPSANFVGSTFGNPVTNQQILTGFNTATPSFGSGNSTVPAFGSTSSSTFGSSSAPTFGFPASTQATTLFGNSSNSFKFGGTSTATPAFGAGNTTAISFGSNNMSNMFGANNTATVAPNFGPTATTTTTSFGIPSSFGNTNTTNFGFNLNTPSTTTFGFSGASTTSIQPQLAFGAQTGLNLSVATTTATLGVAFTQPSTTSITSITFGNIGAAPAYNSTATTNQPLGFSITGFSNTGIGASQFGAPMTATASIFNTTGQTQTALGNLKSTQLPTVLGTATAGGFSFLPSVTTSATVVSLSGIINTTSTASVQSVGPSFFSKPVESTTASQALTTLPQFNFLNQSSAPSSTTADNFILSSALKATIASTQAFSGFATTGLVSSSNTNLTASATKNQPVLTISAPKSTSSQLSSLLNTTTTAKVSAPITGLATNFPGVTTQITQVTTTANTLNSTFSEQEKPLTYSRFDELINNWNKDLEENEKIFLDQATHVNHWDRIISENGDKITQLNQEMEQLNVDLGRLDQDLDFVVGQQNEIENILKPIEEGLDQLPPVEYQQHADLQREQIFKMAENLDVELKQVGIDLKEMVEHLNESRCAQDSSNPVLQITKILNEHIDSMEWISRNKEILQKKANDLSLQLENQKTKMPNLLINKYKY